MNDVPRTPAPTSADYQQFFESVLPTLLTGRRMRVYGVAEVTKEAQAFVDASKDDPVALAGAYIAVRAVQEKLAESLETLTKMVGAIKNVTLPQLFEDRKTKTVTVEIGGTIYRVSVSQVMRASIKGDADKEKAYQWLRDNGLDALITETVNASTLSATAKAMIEDGKELDAGLFNVAVMPNTSVTKVK